ncbi:MAG TPA: lipocalin-like domain-containing protein [Nitrospirota bacterium]|nr:lipocalin-like domain-containing protein [Nitrospirota bacterium]
MKEVASILLVVAVIAFGMLSGASEVRAQEKGGTLASQIQGSWILVSMQNEQDGKRTDVFGPNPKGSIMLTHDGRFSIILMSANLPKFAVNNRKKGTAEENQAVVQGSVAFFGSYSVVNEKENMVQLNIESCTFPNWTGEVQKRIMVVKGDEMNFTTPAAAIGGTNYLFLKRAR